LETAKLQSNAELTSDSATFDNCNNESFKWSYAATLFLIEEYRLQEKNLTSGNMSQKRVWNNIASALSIKGY